MLDLKGENRFKIIAYENAAQLIRTHPQELVDIYAREGIDGLEAIDGVGEGIAGKLKELFETGTLRYYDRLKNKVPQIELDLLDVAGIGPKTSQKLFRILEPSSVSDLKQKLRSAKAREEFGEKTVENILLALKERRHEDRYLISDVLPVAERLVEWLKQRPEVVASDLVGSLRRRKETIGDIDVVAATRDQKKTVDAFTKAKFVRRVIRKGEEGVTTIFHESGFAVDLELTNPDNYGSLLQHFTGGKEHNVALRTWASSKGLRLSEDGITTETSGRTRRFKTEDAFYKSLGMDCPPPELRENRGEIEVAQARDLPDLIDADDIRGNLHIHTSASDGRNTLEEMVEAAYAFGYEYIAITDHSQGAGAGLSEREFSKHRNEIRRVDDRYRRRKRPMRIFTGAEVNIRPDGSLDLSDEFLSSLDFVIASVHSSFRQSEKEATKRVLAAIHHPFVHSIGHPSGRKLLERPGMQLNWDAVYEAAAKTGTLLEINAFPDRLDLSDTRVHAAKELGVQFAINTDAHSPKHYELMRYGVWVARRGWLEKRDVMNTRTVKQFAQWLERQKKL